MPPPPEPEPPALPASRPAAAPSHAVARAADRADAVLAGGGEMGARMRALDWARTPVGPVEAWPASLRALVRLLLDSRQPMFLWWGPTLVQFYNDGYRPSLGQDRHPAALGADGRAFWADAWPIIGPEIEGILAGGPATWHEDHLVPILRNGRMEDVWWTYGCTPARDDAGAVAGVLVTVVETTTEVRARQERGARLEEQAAAAGRARAAAAASEAKYHSLFERIDEGFCVVEVLLDAEGRPADYRWVETNPAFERQTGLRDAVGRTARELVPGLEQHWVDVYGRVARTGTPVRFQQGSEVMGRWFDVYAFRVGAPAERQVAILFTDVTAARAAEQERERLLAAERSARAAAEAARAALAESESKFRFALAVADLGAWDLDLATQHAWRSLRHDQIFGYAALLPAWTYEQFLAHVVPEDRARVDASFGGALAAAAPWDFTCRIRRADGAERWIAARGAPIADAAGVPVRLVGVVRDVTAEREVAAERERLLAETEAARAAADLERRRLLAVLEQLPVGVHVAEAPSGRLVLDNAAVRAICGEAPRSARVADYSADYAGHYPAGHPRAGEPLASDAWPLARALATGAPAGEELVEIRRADETRRLVRVGAAPVRDADGRVVGAVATSVDVTDQVLARRDVERALAEAEAANRAKGEFLAVMSHELRTPLNAIAGYAELIELGIHGPVTAEQRTALDRIQRSQRALLSVINEVLNYARLETGAVTYDLADVPVAEAVGAAEVLVAPQLRAKGLGYAWTECEPRLAVRADRDKLQQVLLNLLSNAVKFTEARDGRPGRIETSCATEGDRVRIRVRDTGIGIPPEKLDAVFEPFVQVDARLTRTQQGTGLGLAISRDLARGMGGELTAESTPGVGSTFTLTLPRA